MEINTIEMYGKKELYLLGDVHLPRGCISKFKAVIDEIKYNKDAVAILMGDYIEGISHKDTRYHPEEIYKANDVVGTKKRLHTLISDQFDDFEQLIMPIRSKILGMHAGNHEDKITKNTGSNELERICKRLDVRYFNSGTALTRLHFPFNDIVIQSSHGTGGGFLAGAAYNKLDRTSNYFEGVDIIAKGHTHKLGINSSVPPLVIDWDKKKTFDKKQYQCSTGSFLTNYEEGIVGYGERAEFAPLPIGYIKVFIDDGRISNISPIYV